MRNGYGLAHKKLRLRLTPFVASGRLRALRQTHCTTTALGPRPLRLQPQRVPGSMAPAMQSGHRDAPGQAAGTGATGQRAALLRLNLLHHKAIAIPGKPVVAHRHWMRPTIASHTLDQRLLRSESPQLKAVFSVATVAGTRAVADLFTTKTKGSEPLSADRVVIGYEKE